MNTFANAPFNPYHMRPLATINSRAVAALPGVDPRCAGKTGSQLVTKRALIELIAAHAGRLGLEGADPAETPRLLNERLEAGDPLAGSIAEEYGRRLGYVLASMALSPQRLADPPDAGQVAWEDAYLRHWRAEARGIVLGGGHATGRLGAATARAAQEALAGCGLPGWRVTAAEYPAYLPLIGAARSLAQPGESAVGPSAAVVADFGGTRAKSGVAVYDPAGRLARLLVLPPRDVSALTAAGDVPGMAAAMVAVLAAAFHAAEAVVACSADAATGPLDARILCSVGAYVEDGQPANIDRGIYTWLNRLTPDLKGWFSRQVSQASGGEARVRFGHDCDLAACSQAGRANSAVIMLGSGTGVGFVPPEEGFAAVAEGFGVVEE